MSNADTYQITGDDRAWAEHLAAQAPPLSDKQKAVIRAAAAGSQQHDCDKVARRADNARRGNTR